MNCLKVERLHFERDDLPILEDVSFTLNSGDIVQLAGHNGCGKTTLLRMIGGLIQPSSGSISWNGSTNESYDFKSSLLFLGHHVGVKLTMTPMENLRWFFGLNGTKQQGASDTSITVSDSTLIEALSEVKLSSLKDVPCYQMSAGQQRRVALARLYVSKAPIWLLDEPFTAIDKEGVSSLEAKIEQHADEGGIVILTTHQTWNVEKVNVMDLTRFKPTYRGEYD